MDIHAARFFLTHRPPVMTGESAPGYVFRAAHIGGHKRMKDLVAALIDRQVMQPPWTLPSNLNALYENLKPVFASAEQIALDHTCLPAHLPFVNPAVLERLYANVYEGKKSPGLPAALGLTGRAIVSTPQMAMCITCVREETLRYGFAWWRREHALAGIGYCPHHARPLVVGCRKCRFSQAASRVPRLPMTRCWCGNPHKASHPQVSAADGEVLTRIARLGLQLLEGALAGRTPAEIGAYYHWKAHEEGFAAGTRIKSVDLASLVLARYSTAVLRRLNAVLQPERGWLQVSMGQRVAPNILGRNLLLLDFFGSRVPTAEDFEQAVGHARRLAGSSPRASAAAGTLEDIEADRRVILAFLQKHPGASRTLVLKKLGRVVVRARERDADWYDCLLKSQRTDGRKRQTEAEVAAYWELVDERTSAHVLQRHAELLGSTHAHPKPMTKTALLKGAPRGNQLSAALLKRLPRTAAALERCVETRHQYKVRFATAILERSPTGEAVMEAKVRTGLSLTEVDRLNQKLAHKKA
jgi:hypothetical protein